MSRPSVAEHDPAVEHALEAIASMPARAAVPDFVIDAVTAVRARSAVASAQLDRALLAQIGDQRRGLLEARQHLHDLESVLDELRSTPWHPATFLGPATAGGGAAALVNCAQGRRVVRLGGGMTLDMLSVGDELLLGRELNVVLERLESGYRHAGETVTFQRALGEGRLLVTHRDEDVIVRAASGLCTDALQAGDRLRCDRTAGLAYERIEGDGPSYFLEAMPDEGFETIGGLDGPITAIRQALELHRLHPDAAVRYGVRSIGAVLLVGPPGTGKTMLARAVANWLGRRAESGRSRFISMKPGEMNSMWFGESEKNIRDVFRRARTAATACEPVVVFLDEVDAIGRIRGSSAGHVDDRILLSLSAELDGLERRGNVFIVAATNRRDALDPALARPGRLGDLVVEIPRPGMVAARDIFAKHVPATTPYAEDSGGTQAIIDAAVSRLYAPNGVGEVASIVFRDGTRRRVHASDLMNGAHIANIARGAIERACLREIAGGPAGLRCEDLFDAIGSALASAVSILTPGNCHAHLSDLPPDLTVARVESHMAKESARHRYRRAS